jgi:hypothetical protein
VCTLLQAIRLQADLLEQLMGQQQPHWPQEALELW